MSYFVISSERFVRLYNDNLRKYNKGILNWFVSENRFVNIFLHIDGVKYLYKEREDDIDVVISMILRNEQANNQILGVINFNELNTPKRKVNVYEPEKLSADEVIEGEEGKDFRTVIKLLD